MDNETLEQISQLLRTADVQDPDFGEDLITVIRYLVFDYEELRLENRILAGIIKGLG